MDFKEFIWDLFPTFYHEHDTYKTPEGKGITQRFIKCFGIELDEEVVKFLDEEHEDYFLNNIEALKTKSNLLPAIKAHLGNPPSIFSGADYNKMLQYIVPIYKIKGTELSYTLFINLIGFNLSLIEHEPEDGVEPYLYDVQPIYLYDQGDIYDVYDDLGIWCSEYSLLLTSAENTVTEEAMDRLRDIIGFLEPINARLRDILFSLPSQEDTLSLCFPQSLRIKLITEYLYDQQILLAYDQNFIYDSDDVMQQTIINLDCSGSSTEEGIGFWDIGGENIVQ